MCAVLGECVCMDVYVWVGGGGGGGGEWGAMFEARAEYLSLCWPLQPSAPVAFLLLGWEVCAICPLPRHGGVFSHNQFSPAAVL